MAIDKELGFWIGNAAGLVVLLVAIAIVAPQKAKERQEYLDKQKDAAAHQAADATAKKDLSLSVSVVAAANDIQAGDLVKESDITLKPVTAKQRRPQMLSTATQAVGKSARHKIRTGQPILDIDLESPAAPGQKEKTPEQKTSP